MRLFAFSLVSVALLTSTVWAGPFGIFGRRSSGSCADGSCSPAQVQQLPPPKAMPGGPPIAPLAPAANSCSTSAQRGRLITRIRHREVQRSGIFRGRLLGRGCGN